MATGGARARARGPVLSLSAPAGEAASATLRFHLRAFARHEMGARHGDVEAVHQLRVSTRRLRATLRLFGRVLPEEAARRVGDELAWLGRAIGAVRDLDVLIAAIPARARRLEVARRDALGPLDAALRARRAAAHASLVRTLDTPRCQALIARVGTLGHPRRSARLAAAELAAPLVRAVHRAGRRLDEDADADAFHRLRVRVKRLRYGLETLRPLGGSRVAKMLRRLEKLQDLLGDHQDAVGQGAHLRELAGQVTLPPATLLAMGSLVQLLARRAARRRRRFARLWRRVDRRRLRRGILEELARHRGHAPVLQMVRRTGT